MQFVQQWLLSSHWRYLILHSLSEQQNIIDSDFSNCTGGGHGGLCFTRVQPQLNSVQKLKHPWLLSENKLSWLVDSQGITEFGLSLFQATCNPQEQQWQPQPEQHQSIEDSSSWWCTWLLYSRICNPCEFRVGRLLSIKLEWCGGWGIASNLLRARF